MQAETVASSPQPLPHVVIVDDDVLFLRTFAANIESAGYRVSVFSKPAEALTKLLQSKPPDACVLDWQMPEMDGLDLLRRLKAGSFSAPVMFLTSMNQPLFEETAFEHGAVEYVDKTRSLSVILKRLERLIATPASGIAPPPPRVEEIGALKLDHESKRAYWRGQQVPLSMGEFDVVALLASKTGADVSYRQIYDVIQDMGFVGGRGPDGYRANVRAAIKRIRRKFCDLDPQFDALKNYPGFGYRWDSQDLNG
jgi:two-component system, OmpR family, response regulator ChvI